MYWEDILAHASIKQSMPQLMISLAMLNQPTRPPTVIAATLSQTLPNTPTYLPATAVLAGYLLAIGGSETSTLAGAVQTKVYMYSPSTNSWM